MDFNVFNEDFINTYDELSQLNEDSSKQKEKAFADLAADKGLKNPEYTDAQERALKRATARVAGDKAAISYGITIPALIGWVTLALAAPPVAAICAGVTGAGLVASAAVDIIEKSQYKKATDGKINVQLLVEQDPELKHEIQQLINKVGKRETEQILAKLEKQLEEHPEILDVSEEELEATRDRLTQIIQKTSAEKIKQTQKTSADSKASSTETEQVTEQLHETVLSDSEEEEYSVDDFSAEEQNFCRQYLKDLPNISWLIDNDESSFAICLDELGYAKSFFDTTNAWDKDKEFDFAAKSLDTWKNLMLKPVEDTLARQLPKLKQHIKAEGYDNPDEVYVVAARNLFLAGLCETLPHWKPDAEGLNEAMLVDDEDDDSSVNDFSVEEQNFCRQFLKDLPNISWLINNDDPSFVTCLEEVNYAKNFYSVTNEDDKDFGFAAKSLDTWKNLMLKPVEDDLARQLPKLKQHMQTKDYDNSDEVYIVAARNLFFTSLSNTLPHWKE